MSQAVTAAVVHELAQAGCLVEPTPPKPAMTVTEAARLLCELSLAPRLQPPDEEFGQLLSGPAMVTYAWTQASGAGIPPTQLSDAHEARRVLLAHHRKSDGPQS